MNTDVKYIAVGLGIILIIIAIIFGAILPTMKSQRYINALNAMSTIRDTKEFKANFDNVFYFYSPIGDEEIAKFLGSNVLGFISNPKQTEQVSRDLVAYIEPRMFHNNVRHLLMLGQMYFFLWQHFGADVDYQKAVSFYSDALVIGPKLPPVLEALLQIYSAKGDVVRAREIASRIVALWPDHSAADFLKKSK